MPTGDASRPLDREGYLRLLLGDAGRASGVACERCGHREVDSVERQTRSSDEPVSIFHTCRACKYVWMEG